MKRNLILVLLAVLILFGCVQKEDKAVNEDVVEVEKEIKELVGELEDEEIHEHEIPEDIYYFLIDPVKKLGAEGLQYNFEDLDLKFRLPAGYPAHNVFEYIEGDGLVIYDTNDVEEISKIAIGDGWMGVPSIERIDSQNATLKDFVEDFKSFENVLSEEFVVLGTIDYVKMVITSFGNAKLSYYITKIGNSFYVFKSAESDEDLLIKIIDSAEYIKPKNVLDYFREIPDKFFMNVSLKDREEGLDVLDIDNYYLDFSPLTWDGNGSFAIFIKPDGGFVFVGEMKGCGPACEQDIFFLEKRGDKFVDVEKNILPEIDFSKQEEEFLKSDPDAPFIPLFIIPRYSTTVEIREQFSDELLNSLIWKGGKFVLDK